MSSHFLFFSFSSPSCSFPPPLTTPAYNGKSYLCMIAFEERLLSLLFFSPFLPPLFLGIGGHMNEDRESLFALDVFLFFSFLVPLFLLSRGDDRIVELKLTRFNRFFFPLFLSPLPPREANGYRPYVSEQRKNLLAAFFFFPRFRWNVYERTLSCFGQDLSSLSVFRRGNLVVNLPKRPDWMGPLLFPPFPPLVSCLARKKSGLKRISTLPLAGFLFFFFILPLFPLLLFFWRPQHACGLNVCKKVTGGCTTSWSSLFPPPFFPPSPPPPPSADQPIER